MEPENVKLDGDITLIKKNSFSEFEAPFRDGFMER